MNKKKISTHRHLAYPDVYKELIIVDGSFPVLVESVEEFLGVLFGKLEAGFPYALGELLEVEAVGSVVVHSSKNSATKTFGSEYLWERRTNV